MKTIKFKVEGDRITKDPTCVYSRRLSNTCKRGKRFRSDERHEYCKKLQTSNNRQQTGYYGGLKMNNSVRSPT